MALMIAIYGKGGIGKSTITSNLATAFSHRGKKVLQIGCDPKHDSTFPITHKMIPTVVEVLKKHRFHHEEISLEEIIHVGYAQVNAIEIGGPPAGVGCGGYAIGDTIQLLEKAGTYEQYDIILFDILGDVVCGGFSVPLQYAKYVCIVCTNDFDSLFAANRIISAVSEKSTAYPVRLCGLIGNRCSEKSLIEKLCNSVKSKTICIIDESNDIRNARVSGQTLFELADNNNSLTHYCEPFLKIADYMLSDLKCSACVPLTDRDLFKLLMENVQH
ncbi:MAG: ferredoxin:protochlorophyllide reductase (ATP-dependent) iron-sulfur ATP-binding protein [Chitinispirillia bacterium]|jgi:light-independent protochlorophyllide reductase subunit L